MSVLYSTISRRDRLGAVKKLIEVYLVCNDIGYHDSDLNLLAYYCLYGAAKGTDVRIREEYYRRLPEKNGKYSVWKTRSKLAKLGLLVRDPYTLELSVKPELLAGFTETTRLGYLLNFTYEELEANPAATIPGVQPTPKANPADNRQLLDAHPVSAEKPNRDDLPDRRDRNDENESAAVIQTPQVQSDVSVPDPVWSEGFRWEDE